MNGTNLMRPMTYDDPVRAGGRAPLAGVDPGARLAVPTPRPAAAPGPDAGRPPAIGVPPTEVRTAAGEAATRSRDADRGSGLPDTAPTGVLGVRPGADAVAPGAGGAEALGSTRAATDAVWTRSGAAPARPLTVRTGMRPADPTRGSGDAAAAAAGVRARASGATGVAATGMGSGVDWRTGRALTGRRGGRSVKPSLVDHWSWNPRYVSNNWHTARQSSHRIATGLRAYMLHVFTDAIQSEPQRCPCCFGFC
jgi:hypothetical protein